MPSECSANPLQRALADSIIRMVSMDDLRILLACGAKVSQIAVKLLSSSNNTIFNFFDLFKRLTSQSHKDCVLYITQYGKRMLLQLICCWYEVLTLI